MTCFMCGHDRFKAQLESTNIMVERAEKPQMIIAAENIHPTFIWCSRCPTLVWDKFNGWASGDMANVWEWNGHTLVLKERVTEADLTKEIQKLGKDKLKLILEALQKETQV